MALATLATPHISYFRESSSFSFCPYMRAMMITSLPPVRDSANQPVMPLTNAWFGGVVDGDKELGLNGLLLSSSHTHLYYL